MCESVILYSGVYLFLLVLPQISPHGRPRCGSGRPGVVAEKVPAAGSSASAQGLSCIWAQSDTLPLQAAGLGTEVVEGPQDHLGPSLADSVDWRDNVFERGDGRWQSRTDGEGSTRYEWEDKGQERRVQGKRVMSVWFTIHLKQQFKQQFFHFHLVFYSC